MIWEMLQGAIALGFLATVIILVAPEYTELAACALVGCGYFGGMIAQDLADEKLQAWRIKDKGKEYEF